MSAPCRQRAMRLMNWSASPPVHRVANPEPLTLQPHGLPGAPDPRRDLLIRQRAQQGDLFRGPAGISFRPLLHKVRQPHFTKLLAADCGGPVEDALKLAVHQASAAFHDLLDHAN